VRRHFLQIAFSLLAALTPVASLHAETAPGDADRGKIRSKAEQCQECHGEAGLGTSENYPKLAGQWAGYIRKQLNDFQSGARKSEIMTAMASVLSQQDIADIAAYFSGAPRWDAEEVGSSTATGQNLYNNGDAARGLPACGSCHGATGAGTQDGGMTIPAIGGQRPIYLTSQLHLWKVEDRENSPGGAMNAVAKTLSDGEIQALATFLASQRPDR
jgi:cytochrome c553